MCQCFGALKFDFNDGIVYDDVLIYTDDVIKLKDNVITSLYYNYKSKESIVGLTRFKNDLYILNGLSQVIIVDEFDAISICDEFVNLSSIYSTDLFLLLIKENNTLFMYKNKADLLSNNCVTYTLPTIKYVSCGKEHALFLLTNSEIYSLGSNKHGQLGLGDFQAYDNPQKLHALSGLNVIKIASGGWHNSALTDTGDMYVWGWNESGQLGLSKDCNICDIPHDDLKYSIQTIPHPIVIDEDTIFTQIACGSRHSIALTNIGELYGCGWNKYGQLNLPTDNLKVPEYIKLPKIQTIGLIIRVFSGGWTTIIETKLD